jgi:hypothetical protein
MSDSASSQVVPLTESIHSITHKDALMRMFNKKRHVGYNLKQTLFNAALAIEVFK